MTSEDSVEKNTATGGAGEAKKPREGRRYFSRREPKKPAVVPKVVVKQPKFVGKNEDLVRGHVYDCSDARQSDIFMKTTKEVSEYVGSNFKYGSDVSLAIENLAMTTLVEPADPADNATKTQIRMWEKKVDEFVKRKTYLEENLKTVYSLVWGQCTNVMRQKVKATKDFKTLPDDRDCWTEY
jgi:hypothetical protein